jgi:hypothetical protein
MSRPLGYRRGCRRNLEALAWRIARLRQMRLGLRLGYRQASRFARILEGYVVKFDLTIYLQPTFFDSLHPRVECPEFFGAQAFHRAAFEYRYPRNFELAELLPIHGSQFSFSQLYPSVGRLSRQRRAPQMSLIYFGVVLICGFWPTNLSFPRPR